MRDEAVRRRVVEETSRAIAALGLDAVGTVDSEVPGVGGNREAFALYSLHAEAAEGNGGHGEPAENQAENQTVSPSTENR